jgi:hypothetical protein
MRLTAQILEISAFSASLTRGPAGYNGITRRYDGIQRSDVANRSETSRLYKSVAFSKKFYASFT